MHFIEAFKMAITAIFAHKLRSFLTLLGIVAGVASIIGVMTGISVIQNTIEKEMSVLGTTVFQVQKLPRGGISSREEFLRLLQRRPLTMEHVEILREKAKNVTLVGAELWKYGYTAKYRDIKSNGDGNICGGTPEYGPNNTHYVVQGRTLSREDVKLGRSVVVIGFALAQELFPFSDPIGKTIKLENRDYRIVGVFGEKNPALEANTINIALSQLQISCGCLGQKMSAEWTGRFISRCAHKARKFSMMLSRKCEVFCV